MKKNHEKIKKMKKNMITKEFNLHFCIWNSVLSKIKQIALFLNLKIYSLWFQRKPNTFFLNYF